MYLILPQPKGTLTDDEVAALVSSEERDRIQHIIVRPLAGIVADLQYPRVCAGEASPQETGRPHVLQEIGQAIEPTVPHGLV